MPVQTTKTSNIYFPDGCVVAVKADGEASYTDVGAINSAVTATLNWTENQIETANSGKTQKQIKEMVIEGGFTLINLEPEGVERMGGGVFTKVESAGSEVSAADITDQVIPVNWEDNVKYELEMYDSSAGVSLNMSTKPTLSAVTLDPGTADEVLAEIGADAAGDYMIVADPGTYSGWSIIFNSLGMGTGTPKTKTIQIEYGDNTPVESTTIYAGSSTATLTAYAMQITHTDSNDKIRRLELYSVDANSGGFQFNFKGANEDGLEEMPLTYTARIDTSLTDGRQLFAWTIENGAA